MTTKSPETSTPSTGFDLSKYSISQGFTVTKKHQGNVTVGKPTTQSFVQFRDGAEWKASVWLLKVKEDREFYLVDPSILETHMRECEPYELHVYVMRDGSVGIWPIRLTGADGKGSKWWDSAREAATMNSGKWLRIQANMTMGGYDTVVAQGDLGSPEWPELTLNELLEKAFKNKIIQSEDHDVLKKLQGKV